MIQVWIFRESDQTWQETSEVSMSDAVRLTNGVRAFIITDPTGYVAKGGGELIGDLTSKYKQTLRAIKSRNRQRINK